MTIVLFIFHFCRIFAAVFLPCSYFQFSPALFPFSSFFFYRQIVFAALLCPLRRDLIPTFFWEQFGYFWTNLRKTWFFAPQNLHISKILRTFAPQSSHWGPRRTQTKRVRWGERRHRLPVYLAERYKPLHTDCRTRRVPLHQISESPLIH